jgi:hypothetical protein
MTAVEIIAAAIVLVILVNFWQFRNAYANAINENEISIVQSRNTSKYAAYDEMPLRGNSIIRAITSNYYDIPVFVDAGYNSAVPGDSFKADTSLTSMFVRPEDSSNPPTLGREYSSGTEANPNFKYWFAMGKRVDGVSLDGKTLGDMFTDDDIYMSFALRGGAIPDLVLAQARAELQAWLDTDPLAVTRDGVMTSLGLFRASADLQGSLGYGDVAGILLIDVIDGNAAYSMKALA